MKLLLKLVVIPMCLSIAFAEEYRSDGPLGNKGDIETANIIMPTATQLIALNLLAPVGGNINEFATSGASSSAEVGLDPSQYSVNEQVPVNDPWEGFNRKVHSFNNQVDKYVARPLAVAYEKVTPLVVQQCVSRFFSNLREPGTAVNQALQGNSFDGLRSLGRFAVNTTIGIVGLYDPATYFGMKRGYEDFGQTLAIWGWEDSRYFVVPILGPRTVRDTVGIVGDQPLSPMNHINNTDVVLALNILQLTDARTRLLPLDAVKEEALDDYIMTRDAWITRRSKQIDAE